MKKNENKKQVKIIQALPTVNDDGKSINSRKRVAAYCRVSSSHLEQIDEYKKRIKNNPDWEFVAIYAVEAKSGTNTKTRVEFNRIIQDCEDGKVDLLLTKSISRFARNVEDSVGTVRLLKSIGVEVFFEKENIYSFDSKSGMIFTILASVAQEESRNIAENSSWGIKKKMRDGKIIINHNRFLGYDKNEEGETVRYIFERYLQGAGYTTIARELQDKGALTGSGNTRWHGSTVSGILQNEKYYGNLLQQKTYTVDFFLHKRVDNKGQKEQYLVENNHPAIVSKEMWLAAKKKKRD